MDAHPIELFAGLETTVNEPFLMRRGGRVGAALRPLPMLGVVASGAWYPTLGDADWTGAAKAMIARNQRTPMLSRVTGQGALLVEVTPIHVPANPTGAALRLGVGGGLVSTLDELALLEVSPAASADAFQVQPDLTWSIGADVQHDLVVVGIRASEVRYVEQVQGTDVRKDPLFLGFDVGITPARRGGS